MSRSLNRREFIQRATLAGSGLWLAGRSQGAPRVGRSANEKLNIACIGAGGRGAHNLKAVSGENIVALCDVDESQAGKSFEEYPKAERFHDFRKMLEKRKDIDAVVVSTPDHMHAPAALMAMRLGKHVYCEKPLARTVAECRMLAEAAAKAKVTTQMGNQGHSNPGAKQAVDLIQSGIIGPVHEVHAWSDRPIWPQGMTTRPAESPAIPSTLHWDLWLGVAAERRYSPDYLPFKWRGWWDFGCGAMGDMACHIVDVAFWALYLRHPTRIEASSSGISSVAAPAWSIITWTFPARGGMAPTKLTWYDGGKKPPAELFEGEKVIDNGSLLIGEKGKMYVPHAYGGKFTLLPRDRFEEREPSSREGQSSTHQRAWITACKTGELTGSNFTYAAAMTETLLLGNLALRMGQPIEWNGKAMKVRNVAEANEFLHPYYRNGWTL